MTRTPEIQHLPLLAAGQRPETHGENEANWSSEEKREYALVDDAFDDVSF